MRMNDAEFADWSPGEAMLEDRSRLSFDWLEIEDRAESFAALRALPKAGKQALFAACVARTVNGQLAFEHGARPELEATVARLDIDFAKHVRPTADMYWSRIAKGRIMETARAVCGPAWASSRSKYKKPALAKTMEEAFAAGDPPLGLGADAHAAALAWTMPGFAAFDTGGVDGDDAATSATTAAVAPRFRCRPGGRSGSDTRGQRGHARQGAGGRATTRPRRCESRQRRRPHRTRRRTANGEGAAHPQADGAETAPPDAAPAGEIAGAAGTEAPAPMNGHGRAPEPVDIPEFLRRVQ